MQRIVVLNPKGGSGKTTIAINLASYYAQRGERLIMMDFDPQGSSAHWLSKRMDTQPRIGLIAAFERDPRITRSFQLRIPNGTDRVVVDTPAALQANEIPELIQGADKILVPVLPSDIDIHACSRCVQNLLLVAKLRRDENRLAIIANRVRRNTVIYQSLMRFLTTFNIPIVATLRDSQNYVRSAECGMGLPEMKPHQVAEDWADWRPMLEWLQQPSKLGAKNISAAASMQRA
jgi:chromosome partitioning protein